MLRGLGRGVAIGTARVPIVVQAILFDLLNGGDKDWGRFSPYRELGWQAAEAARSGAFVLGSVGAGTGATTATLKGGIGSASSETGTGFHVAALVAVNAVGTASLGDGPYFWAAPFERGGEFGGLGWPPAIPPDALTPRFKGAAVPPETGTTIGLVVTDAPLTKAQAKRLAIAGQGRAGAGDHAGSPSLRWRHDLRRQHRRGSGSGPDRAHFALPPRGAHGVTRDRPRRVRGDRPALSRCESRLAGPLQRDASKSSARLSRVASDHSRPTKSSPAPPPEA